MADRDKYPVVTCQLCGVTQQATYSEPTKTNMVERQLCFICLFWTGLIEGDRSNMFVCKGHHYTIGPEEVSRVSKGSYGRSHKITFGDGRRVTTTNLWHQGKVPDRFREQLPDTASFVKETR